jgi:predicted enzyme related to lactoylglutathione lyase
MGSGLAYYQRWWSAEKRCCYFDGVTGRRYRDTHFTIDNDSPKQFHSLYCAHAFSTQIKIASMSRHSDSFVARSGTVIITLVVLIVGGCSTANMPAITDEPTQTTLQGKVVWHDLITDVPGASKKFYGELFGWEFEEVGINRGLFNAIDYTLIRHNGRLIGGMVDQAQLKTREDVSQWISLISVVDVDVATAAVTAAGGTVLTAPLDLAQRGRSAVVVDPQGALITLLQTNSRDPLDEAQADVGGFLWNELWTEDISAAAEFYKQLADYSEEDNVVQDNVKTSNRYRLLSSQGKPRVGIMPTPVEDLSPIWVSYLRIEDAAALDAIVARVEALGGAILLDPQDREIGGRVALIAGPSGAGIALQTWPFEANE